MKIETPNQEKLLTSEVIQILKKRYEGAKQELLRNNRNELGRVQEINSEDMRGEIIKKLGYITYKAGEIDQKLELSLN